MKTYIVGTKQKQLTEALLTNEYSWHYIFKEKKCQSASNCQVVQ